MTEQDKVTVDDIIGIVKTEEQTNSVEEVRKLRGRGNETAKRFRVQEHCLRSSYGIEAENWLVTNDNHSVVLNDKAEAHMVANMSNDVIDKLNEQHETIQRLQENITELLSVDIEEELLKENEQLKRENYELHKKLGDVE